MHLPLFNSIKSSENNKFWDELIVYNSYTNMFNKLSPLPIHNVNHRRLLIFAMFWFFSGAWIDSSAHTYLLDDIETFFTPWHAVLYSGYAFSVFVALYIKNSMKDYKFDVGVLGAVIFGIGGASDAIWHTLLGIEVGVEPLITPSHLMLFLGSFLMLDYVFTTRPSKEKLDSAAIFSAATSYALVMFITSFLNPVIRIGSFYSKESYLEALSGGAVIFQTMLASIVFVYLIRFKASPKQIGFVYFLSFFYISINTSMFDLAWMGLIIGFGGLFALLMYRVTTWYYKTNHDRKIQVSAALTASVYGLVFVLYFLTFSFINGYEVPWRFYGLGGLVTTPLLLGYMVGNLGVSPSTGEVVE